MRYESEDTGGMATTVLTSTFHADKLAVEADLQDVLSVERGAASGPVGEAMRYAVFGDAQRIRPLLALRVARLTGSENERMLRAASAVELLHCASLIVDDLPCMDDEKMRRNRPTVHMEFGEAMAVLAAFGFQIDLLSVMDCTALIGGQALDLKLQGAKREAQRAYVSQLKTSPLFRVAVRAGMIFADLNALQCAALAEFGQEFGLAFQMADDYLDGEETSPDPLRRQLDKTRRCLDCFGSEGRDLEGLLDYLHARAWQKTHCHR